MGGAILRGRRLIEGRLFFEETRYIQIAIIVLLSIRNKSFLNFKCRGLIFQRIMRFQLHTNET